MGDSTKFFGELEVEESDDRYETIDAIKLPEEWSYKGSNLHHIRISLKDKETNWEAVSIQTFTDESTPHGSLGAQVQTEKLDDLITALERIKLLQLEGA